MTVVARSAATAGASSACTPDIDLLLLFGGRLGRRGRTPRSRAILHPLWDLGLVVGHQVREIDEFAKLEVGQPGVPDGARGREAGGRRPRRCSTGSRRPSITPATHAHVVGALNALIDERYAQFNATLYQLEPDVKEAPGALRDLTATRWIAALTDPSLLRRGPADPARLDETRRTSCCGFDRSCTSRASATRTSC